MKLKYKKIILMTTLSTMGIGILTLSLSHDKTNAEENANNKVAVQSVMSEETAVENGTMDALGTTRTSEPTTVPTPTLEPTPTPIPVYPIEKEGYSEINQLIEDYYSSKNNCDVDALKRLLSDPKEVDSQKELQKKTEYIDDYRNIKVYVKKGYIEGTYIVYAYHEIKFTTINTPAPGLAKFYVITDNKGDLKIFSGDMSEEEKVYYDERNSDEDVIDLIKVTDKKSKEAKKSDEDLSSFWKNIDEMAGQNSDGAADTDKKASEKTAEGDTN